MRQIIHSMKELITNTPLLKLNHMGSAEGVSVYAKLEAMNPTGSVKDRAALSMIQEAEKKGLLSPGGTIIEPTSGNTGIAIAALSATLGYKAVIFMPDTMSKERILLMEAYGAKVVLTPGAEGMPGSIQRAVELQKETENSIVLGQFENPDNPKIHYETTGPEIYEALNGEIDVFVAGVGTGGTLSGTGRYLKEKNPSIQVIAVEPAASAVLEGRPKGPHKIQGIGAGFIPENYDASVADRVLAVENEEAFGEAARFAREEGLLVGISSGAALAAVRKLLQDASYHGKRIAVILPDHGDRYLSSGLFE